MELPDYEGEAADLDAVAAEIRANRAAEEAADEEAVPDKASWYPGPGGW